MRFNTILLLAIVTILWSEAALACHKGGPMGFASNDPGAFSLDVTLSPFYTGASLSGTAGCKEWNYGRHQRIQYLETQWTFIREEASQGEGERLIALAQIMGCTAERQAQFAVLVRNNYSSLFNEKENLNNFLLKIETLLSQYPSLSCSA